jgi:hypothetical protein
MSSIHVTSGDGFSRLLTTTARFSISQEIGMAMVLFLRRGSQPISL